MSDVVLRGIDEHMVKTVRRFLSLGEDCSLPRWAVRYRYVKADTEIARALQTFGYYSPDIEKSLSFDSECWRAEFDIAPGEPVRLREVHIEITGEGKDDPAFQELIARTPLIKTSRLDHQLYETFKSKLEASAAERGYFNAAFEKAEVRVTRDNKTADVNLILRTGPRFNFGVISFHNAPLTDELMDRYLPFNEGDPYEATGIGALYQSLYSSDYFEDVIVDTSVKETDHTVPVDIRLIPTDPARTRVGLGFSTDIGPKFSVSHNNRLLNEHGHRLEGSLSVAPVRKELGLAYRIPRQEHRDGWNTVYGALTDEKTDTSDSTRSTVGFRQVVPRKAGWIETRFIEIVDSKFEIADERNDNFSVVPGVGWSHRSSSTSSRPPSGHHLDLEFSGTTEAFGSTVDYAHVVLKGKIIRPLWGGARVISRTRLGATFSNHFDRLPPTVRFFSGGDDRVRGFEFKSLGPANEDGEVIGGNRVLEVSLEIDQLVREKWAIAIFADAGNATLNTYGSDLETAAGIGVRWYSPLGPLRADLAVPVNSEESGVRLHISFGPDI